MWKGGDFGPLDSESRQLLVRPRAGENVALVKRRESRMKVVSLEVLSEEASKSLRRQARRKGREGRERLTLNSTKLEEPGFYLSGNFRMNPQLAKITSRVPSAFTNFGAHARCSQRVPTKSWGDI